MSSLQHPAFGKSELVQRWLSGVALDATGSESHGQEPEATHRRVDGRKGRSIISDSQCDSADLGCTETGRSQHAPRRPGSPKRGIRGNEKQRVKSEGGRHGETRIIAPLEPEPFSEDDRFPEEAELVRGKDKLRSHLDGIEDPSEKYARRPRHKTREDRYDYKDVPEQRSNKRQSKSSVKKKPGAVLSEEFQAPNVATERLTLKSAGPGFLPKGKTSGSTDWKGLPDLTFSEMTFLKRKREDDSARLQQVRDSIPKKSSKRTAQEISDFFSRPENPKGGPPSTPKPTSNESYVSWSVSLPREPTPLRARGSSLGVGMMENRRRQVEECDDLSVHRSVRPNSSISNQFLKEVTTGALLRGVNTSAAHRKEYYSLEDLKMLAGNTITYTSHYRESSYDCHAPRELETRPAQSQSSNNAEMGRQEDPTRMRQVMFEGHSLAIPEEITPPSTRRQDLSYALESEPRRDVYNTTKSYDTLSIGTGKTGRLYDGQLPPNPSPRPDFAIPLIHEREEDFGLPPIPAYLPLEHIVQYGHHDQQVENYRPQDASDFLYDRQRYDPIIRESSIYADEGHIEPFVDHVQPDLLRAEEPSQSDQSIQKPEAGGAMSVLSEGMDEFDRNLLQNMAEDAFPSGREAMLHSEGLLYEEDASGHHQGEQMARQHATSQYQSKGFVDEYAFQRRSSFLETSHDVVDDQSHGFSGFSRGQVLY